MRAALIHRHLHLSLAFGGVGAGTEGWVIGYAMVVLRRWLTCRWCSTTKSNFWGLRVLREVMICFNVARIGRVASASKDLGELRPGSRLLAMQERMQRRYVGGRRSSSLLRRPAGIMKPYLSSG